MRGEEDYMKKNNFRSEFLKTMIQLATAGFGLVAALAWNEVIKEFIDRYIASGSSLISKLIYALLVTLIAVWVTYILGKMIQQESKDEEK